MSSLLSKVKVAQSCLTFCDPMDYTVHVILQAGILEPVAVPFSRGSSRPRSPALQADSLPAEPSGKPVASLKHLYSSYGGHQTLSFDYFVYNTLIRVVSHSILRTVIKKELALLFLLGLQGGQGAQYTLHPAGPGSVLPWHPALCR